MDNYQVKNKALSRLKITLYSWKACKLYEEWGTSCTPSKDFEKLDHKNAIKYENSGPPSQIYSQPQVSPSKEFENDCAFMFPQMEKGMISW